MQSFITDKQHDVSIPSEDVKLDGLLYLPDQPKGIVLFAHGSGSSRFSPRNQLMANQLHQHQIATLLFDLLTTEEDSIDEYTREYRFNIPLLAKRLLSATSWVSTQTTLQNAIGYFGASTGGGAALLAAAHANVRAVVSRGGRPDLAKDSLSLVKAATLLIVGGQDSEVIKLNKFAFEKLQCEKSLVIIEGATHLFEEPGKLEEVAKVTVEWFEKYL